MKRPSSEASLKSKLGASSICSVRACSLCCGCSGEPGGVATSAGASADPGESACAVSACLAGVWFFDWFFDMFQLNCVDFSRGKRVLSSTPLHAFIPST